MWSVDEALAAVLQRTQPLLPEQVPLRQVVGRRLAQDMLSPEAIPPFDKSLMDGFALSRAAVDAVARAGSLRLPVVETVLAGEAPRQPAGPASTTRVMTGAPLPEGTNAVVPVELVATGADVTGSPWAEFSAVTTLPGKHVLRQGEIADKGQALLLSGTALRPPHVGLLAELGCVLPAVVRRPRVAILATGDELVDPQQATLAAGQIRDSNGASLAALVESFGAETIDLGIARDDEADLTEKIRRGLEADVLMTSGGVSAGDVDLVPRVLTQLGVEAVFHKIKLKPGKPLWFGVQGRTLVFGFPGNPVSTLIGFVLFGAPALRALAGDPHPAPRTFAAALARSHRLRSDRPTYWPGRLLGEVGAQGSVVDPLPWKGSADQTAYALADCLIAFPAGDREWPVHEPIDCVRLD